FNIPWNLAGSFSMQYFRRFDQAERREKSDFTATVQVHGDVSVTPKWKIQFNSGFDFKAKEVSMTRFSIYRDLHCWDMSVGRSEEHTSELQSRENLVCRLLLE